MWYSVILIAGAVIGYSALLRILPLETVMLAGLHTQSPGSPPTIPPGFASVMQLIVALGAIGIGFSIVAFYVLRSGLSILSRTDDDFSTPSKLLLVALVSAPLLLLLLVYILEISIGVLQQLQTSPSSTPNIDLSGLGAASIFLILTALGVLVGYIGGVILGIWRLGSRYDDTLLKVSAILSIIPYLNAIAPVLTLVGAYAAGKKLPTNLGQNSQLAPDSR